jgi:hypothetical protein
LKLPPPWTDDEVLRKYKILNVYRELDACTQYIVNKLAPVKDRKTILINLVFFRFFNKKNIYEELGIELFTKMDDEGEKVINKILADRKAAGHTIFNNAYTTPPGKRGVIKHETRTKSVKYLSEHIESTMVFMDEAEDLNDASNLLVNTIDWVGEFLACELINDLAYLKFFKQNWTDNDLVYLGPGTAWTIKYLCGEKLGKEEQKEFLLELYQLQKEHLTNRSEWLEVCYKNSCTPAPLLSITNLESAMCEFRKYKGIPEGRGRTLLFKY